MADQRVSSEGDECDEKHCHRFDGHEIFWPGSEFFKISGHQPPVGVVKICRLSYSFTSIFKGVARIFQTGGHKVTVLTRLSLWPRYRYGIFATCCKLFG